MKKELIALTSIALLMTGCTNNAGTGAYVGGQFGHVIGSAIGGISGGWRGHHVGSAIGTIGGAVAGAAIGSAIDSKNERAMNERAQQRDVQARRQERGINQRTSTVAANDIIDFGEEELTLELLDAHVVETDNNGVLTPGEECSVSFVIMNRSNDTVYNIRPLVEDATANKHVKVSPNLLVESIEPHKGIRYTATILADKKLKDGEIIIRVGVMHDNQEITSQTTEITVPTAKAVRQK